MTKCVICGMTPVERTEGVSRDHLCVTTEEEAVVEEVVEEAPAEELCEKCGKDPCACEEEKPVEKPKKKATPKKKAAKKA